MLSSAIVALTAQQRPADFRRHVRIMKTIIARDLTGLRA